MMAVPRLASLAYNAIIGAGASGTHAFCPLSNLQLAGVAGVGCCAQARCTAGGAGFCWRMRVVSRSGFTIRCDRAAQAVHLSAAPLRGCHMTAAFACSPT